MGGKKQVSKGKSPAYKALYKKLDTKEGGKNIFKLAKARSKKKQNIKTVKNIKDEVGKFC